jgi:hypothetical protein
MYARHPTSGRRPQAFVADQIKSLSQAGLRLLTRLFPKEAHKTKTYAVYLKHNMARDPEVLNCMQFGGQEALDYFEKKKLAMGLAFCLSEHD